MGLIISIIVSLLISITFLYVNRENKLILMIIACTVFNCFNVSHFSFTNIRNLLCILFFITELKYIKPDVSALRRVRILKYILWVILGALICILFSKNINNIVTFLGFLVTELISKYFVIIYSFVALRSLNSIHKIYRVVFVCLIFITLIGIIDYILKFQFWNAFFGNLENSDNLQIVKYDGERFRVISTFIYAFDYGQVCVEILIFSLYMRYKRFITNRKFITALFCCLFGVIFCGCRTVMATAIIGLSVYLILNYPFSKGFGIALGVLLLGILLYIFVPSVQEKFELLLSAMDPRSKVDGSSSSMRIGQYLLVLDIVKDDIIIGKGHNFFSIDIGWDEGFFNMSPKYRNLYGIEGVMMLLLLERGIVGVLVYIIFYIGLIRTLYRLRRYAKAETAAAISIIISFIAYGNMTGELNSALPTLLFSGIFLKEAYLLKKDSKLSSKKHMISLISLTS